MADIFTAEKRSEIMSKIRSSNTQPERLLFELVRFELGSRRKIIRNAPGLPGRPDVYIPSLAVAIFADGCFFHGCSLHATIPESNREYWEPKIASNIRKDRCSTRKLRKIGISVWRFWDHDLKKSRIEKTRKRLKRLLLKKIKS